MATATATTTGRGARGRPTPTGIRPGRTCVRPNCATIPSADGRSQYVPPNFAKVQPQLPHVGRRRTYVRPNRATTDVRSQHVPPDIAKVQPQLPHVPPDLAGLQSHFPLVRPIILPPSSAYDSGEDER